MHLKEFKEKVYPLKDRLFRFAYWITKNSEDAEDVVQEVFIKLWHIRAKLEQYDRIDALAMRVTKNHCLNFLKSNKKLVALTNPPTINSTPEPILQLEYQELYKSMNKLINMLPDQHKMIIQLRSVEGYSTAEIAEIMELTENNVRVNLSRIRKKLRSGMSNYYDNEK